MKLFFLFVFSLSSLAAAGTALATEPVEVVFPGISSADIAEALRVMEVCKRNPNPGIGMNAAYFCPGGYYGDGWWQLDMSLILMGYKWIDQTTAEQAFLNFENVQQPDGMIPLYHGFLYSGGKRVANPRSQSSLPTAFSVGAQLAQRSPDDAFAARVFRVLDSYFQWWRNARQDSSTGLFTACFEETFPPYKGYGETNAPSDFIALDLNVEMVTAARSLASLAERLGKPAKPYTDFAAKLSEDIRTKLWDGTRGLYSGYSRAGKAFSTQIAATTFYPLRYGIASQEQRNAMLALLADSSRFGWNAFPLTSVDRKDPTFVITNGRYTGNPCWEGDVWMTHNVAAVIGLMDCGCTAQAGELACKTLSMFASNCTEFLNPDDGKGQGVKEYGWTAALYVYLLFDKVFGLDYDAVQHRLTIAPLLGVSKQNISLDGLALPDGQHLRVVVSPSGRIDGTVNGLVFSGTNSLSIALPAEPKAAAQVKGDKEAHSSSHFIDAREPVTVTAPAHFVDARSPAIAGSAGVKTWLIDTSKSLGTVIRLI